VRRIRFAWLVFALIAFRVALVSAAAERVALGGSGSDPQLTRQLRVELGALGFDVVTMDELGRIDLTSEILKLTRDDDLLAIIRVSPDVSRLEVWAADPESGIYVTRGIDLARAGGQPRIIALRAVELLRAGLREIDARRQLARLPPPALPPAPERPPAPSAPPPDASPSPPDTTRRAPSRLSVGAGLGAVASAGGVGTALVAASSIELGLTSNWGAGALGFLSLDQRTVSNDRGSSSVRVFLGGLGPLLRYGIPATRWQLKAAIAVGGAALPTTGSAQGQLVAKTDVATSPTAFASVALGYEVVPDLALTGAILAGALFPRATIQFGGEPVAHWGPLYGAGLVGAALQFR
jgi:hypothetical protein